MIRSVFRTASVVIFFTVIASVAHAQALSTSLMVTPSVITDANSSFTIRYVQPGKKDKEVRVSMSGGPNYFGGKYDAILESVETHDKWLKQTNSSSGVFELTVNRTADPILFDLGVHNLTVGDNKGHTFKARYEVKKTPQFYFESLGITEKLFPWSHFPVSLVYVPDTTGFKRAPNGADAVEFWFWNDAQHRVDPARDSSVVLKVLATREHGALWEKGKGYLWGFDQHFNAVLSYSDLQKFPQGTTTVEAFDANMNTLATGKFTIKLPEVSTCQRFLYNGPPAQKFDLGFIFPNSEKDTARAVLNRYVESGLKAIEPFRSNIDKFNIWYVVLSPDDSKKYDAAVMKNSTGKNLDEQEPWLANFCGNSDETVLFSPWSESRSFHRASTKIITFYSHSQKQDIVVFLHELGHVFGLTDEYIQQASNDSTTGPNCSATTDAPWSDLVVKSSKRGNYVQSLTQLLGYFTGTPQGCFKGDQPISNCYFYLRSRAVFAPVASPDKCTVNPSGGSSHPTVPVQAGCMFKKDNDYWCHIGGHNVSCQSLILSKYDSVRGGCSYVPQNYRPNIASIMMNQSFYADVLSSNLSRGFGPVNERQICRQLEQITKAPKGSMGSVCKQYGL